MCTLHHHHHHHEPPRTTMHHRRHNRYSGFFTTDPAVDNNLFWWYFPPQLRPDANTPTLVWLQGGPGAASTFGLFAEMGPYSLVVNASSPTGFNLMDRPTSWNKRYGMLFIDNPVRVCHLISTSSKFV
jgi:vitellogenic carboxypeptidase-like protein